jgi:Domain of unknown function (DUF4160)
LQEPKRFGIIAVPTTLRVGSLDIIINLRGEHEPPHVHVRHPDGFVIVVLDEATHTVWVRDANRRISGHEVRRVAAIVQQHFDLLLATWSFYHR